jgi:hypothetical protein
MVMPHATREPEEPAVTEAFAVVAGPTFDWVWTAPKV